VSETPKPVAWVRQELLALLAVAATLAGLCVTVVALMKTVGGASSAATIVDDMFALCAVLFLADTYMIFWALTTRRQGLARRVLRALDITFLAALTLMTLAAILMLYTVW
jgi:hypothetical protein